MRTAINGIGRIGRASKSYSRYTRVAIRVPIPVGSISDMTFITGRPVTVQEINSILKEEAETKQYSKVLTTTTDPIVSSDIINSSFTSTVDLNMARVVDGIYLR